MRLTTAALKRMINLLEYLTFQRLSFLSNLTENTRMKWQMEGARKNRVAEGMSVFVVHLVTLPGIKV